MEDANVERYFKTGYMKIFYTDDYPRASLSVMLPGMFKDVSAVFLLVF